MTDDAGSMNCLDFRRRCLAEPGYRGDEFLRHESECEKCARFAAETRTLDVRLADAIRIDVPHDLVGRIKAEHRTSTPGGRWRNVLSVAASILLTIGFASGIVYMTLRTPPLQAAVKEHIEKEWEAIVENDDMDKKTTASVLSNIGAMVKDEAGHIRYASLCDFSEFGSAHLVIEGRKGPALVLLLKEKYVAKARFMAMSMPEGTKLEGMLTHTSTGSMAVVGKSGEELHSIGEIVRDSVFWAL